MLKMRLVLVLNTISVWKFKTEFLDAGLWVICCVLDLSDTMLPIVSGLFFKMASARCMHCPPMQKHYLPCPKMVDIGQRCTVG